MMPLLPNSTLARRLTIAGLFMLALMLAWTVWASLAAKSFSGRVAAIRAAGDPASIADLKPKRIPAEQDAAAQLAEVDAQVDAFARDHGRFFNTPIGKSYDVRHPNEPLTSEQLAAIRAILDRYPEIDAAVRRAAACELYASRLDFTLPHAQFISSLIKVADNRTVARYVRWQVEVAIAEERQEDAVRRGIDMLRLSRLMKREPGVVSGMVAAAIHGSAADATYQALNAGAIPTALHEALDSELSRHDDLRPFAWTVKSERAIVISGLQQDFSGIRGLVLNTLGHPLKMQYTATLVLFDSALQDAEKPWHLVYKSTGALSRSFPQNLGVFANQLQPAVREAYKVANRSLAVSRCLRIVNALHRFERDQKREAESLADLSLPSGATIDPFSGGPLLLKRTEKAWTVYSVGENGNDDGGTERKDFGVGLQKEED